MKGQSGGLFLRLRYDIATSRMVNAEVQRGLFEVYIIGRLVSCLKWEGVEKEELVILRCVLSYTATEDCAGKGTK